MFNNNPWFIIREALHSPVGDGVVYTEVYAVVHTHSVMAFMSYPWGWQRAIRSVASKQPCLTNTLKAEVVMVKRAEIQSHCTFYLRLCR